ncbi:OprO/OprP family phosphate-selective porin [Salinibacter ruber]|uniref:Uncharacterized protein n=1 Tax=Salinibacter ruber TaxID=146919 RepID=A0AAW5PAA0_9BACT|nr:OprO/OprP family phosphate-selective porin [Salinibacter ruber]MCS3664891.1 hypothetical protein [Salinibacter ruber]MCS3956124.1 hypothetical protein [Salinibacter ruber]MCS4055545.1 hypothetical protein [Salinibacter ruber]MCS4058612.1 hypothetical protein [Salinibacter ruber]MCS4158247.1 hypothetical protein [Salinibacter ruber]
MNRYCTAVLALFLTAGLMLPGSALADDPEPADDSTNATSLVANAWESDNTTAPQQDEPTLDVSVNGSLRFNALFRAYGGGSDFDQSSDRVLGDGGFTFDTFRIGASGSYGNLVFDAEYAIYPDAFGGLYIHHGWAGYNFSENRQVQVGVSQVPFGIQPYASSSWFFNNTYYVGLEDDYDAGVKALFTPGNWDIQGGYYMNPEGTTFYGNSTPDRYSYDVIPGQGQSVVEEHQFNAKLAYTFNHDGLGFTKLGVSGQRGQLLDQSTGDTDWHAAYAVHLQGRYGGFETKLEFMQQELNPPNTDDRFTSMGAYGGTYRVANEHTVYSSSLAYHIPLNVGPVSEIKPYYDFSQVTKNVDAWNDNVSHVVGFLTSAGPMFIYTDLIVSKNHPFNFSFRESTEFASVMAEGDDNEFRTAFNINIGIYF